LARYVPDVHTKRWIIIAPKRLDRPSQIQKEPGEKKCPFCVGNEKITPPEVFRIGGGEVDSPGWEVRVVPNLFPITDIHEVIIHSTEHEKDFEDLNDEQNSDIITSFRNRFNFHREHGQVLIFTNHGEATGASQLHPHSQLVVIPNQIRLDALSLEPVCNNVMENNFFDIYCPEFSQWPYEVWFAPKRKDTFFGDINGEEIINLSISLKKILNSLKIIELNPDVKKRFHYTNGFAYNIIIYPRKNWYLRIIPRLMNRAGFELGTGIQLNIVDPCEAASEIAKLIQF
jgi:UDPglucose--hexose-1-phosphate uridylyltransferase